MVSSIFHAAPSEERDRLCGRYFSSTLAHDTIVRGSSAVPAPLVIYLWLIQTGKMLLFKRDTRPERSVKVYQDLDHLHWRHSVHGSYRDFGNIIKVWGWILQEIDAHLIWRSGLCIWEEWEDSRTYYFLILLWLVLFMYAKAMVTLIPSHFFF